MSADQYHSARKIENGFWQLRVVKICLFIFSEKYKNVVLYEHDKFSNLDIESSKFFNKSKQFKTLKFFYYIKIEIKNNTYAYSKA